MRSVFVLQHLHILPNEQEDVKFIGAYSSPSSAKAAVQRLGTQPGFRDFPNVVDPDNDTEEQGFYIQEYELEVDHWSEGYTTT